MIRPRGARTATRLDICRAVVREMGTSRPEDTVMDCPVIAEVKRRWDLADVGSDTFMDTEIGVLIGLHDTVIRKIHVRAMRKARVVLGGRVVDDLRELDALRNEATMPESGGW